MECPYCGEELNLIDYYGIGNPFNSDFKKLGDIYQCENDHCDSNCFNRYFHTNINDDIHEGYPC